jgi:cytoskeletal protein RodZ
MKKQWIILSVFAGIAILALGILLGRVYYQSTLPQPKPTSSSSSSLSSSTSSSSSNSISNSSSASSISSSSSSAPIATLKLFFHKNPDSNNDFTSLNSVVRATTRADVGTFLIEQYLAGPTAAESSAGLYSGNKLTGSSSCDGKDFALSIIAGKATVKLCKTFASAGIGDDARFTSAINTILKQFSTVTTVVILTSDGNCFGDLSGLNTCLAP